MQIMIDTAVDKPSDLYRIGRYLTDTYATSPAPAPDAADEPTKPAFVPPPPPAPIVLPAAYDNNDADVEVDDAPPTVPLPPAAATSPSDASAPIPPPPGPAVPAELDSAGVAWDGRIHAANRAKKIDGTWKGKRGIGANVPGNTPPPVAIPAPTVSVPVPPVSAPPIPPAPPPVASPSPAVVLDFRGLMQKIQQATAAGKLTTDTVNAALASVGLKAEEMAQLINNAPLIASVNAAIDKCLSTS